MTRIHLHIDTLRTDRLTPAQQRSLVAALEREIAQRLADGLISAQPPASTNIRHISAESQRPADTARAVAKALFPAQGSRNP